MVNSLKLNDSTKVLVHTDDSLNPVNNSIQLMIYRILQEQLSNVVKYANASRIEISIQHEKDMIYLKIKDNGNGFNVKAKREGIGLENIRRRVQIQNGKLDIISSPGNGCEMNIRIPYN